MIHDRAEIADFLSDDPRFIAAVRQDDPSKVFVLPDGQANRFRDFARTQLRCFYPDCEKPEIRAVARHPKGRDHFRHLPGAGHQHPTGGEGAASV